MKQDLNTYELTKNKALDLLSFRSLSEKELTDKLRFRGASAENIARTVDFLTEYGFLDDEKYAMRLAKDLQVLKKFGKYRIRAELHNRGINDEFISQALTSIDDDEESALMPLVEKKLAGNFEKKNIDKVMRYFSYRGYGFDDIRHCIDQLKSDAEEY